MTKIAQRGLIDYVYAICANELYYIVAMLYIAPIAFMLGLLIGFML